MSNLEKHVSASEITHATLAELVSIRDGEKLAIRSHVEQCTFCQSRLEEVYSVAASLHDAMMFQAELPVPETAWAAIQSKLEEQRISADGSSLNANQHTEHAVSLDAHVISKPSIWSSVNTAIYSLAAAVMFTGMVSLYTSQGQQQVKIETQALQASIQGLMDSSRGLESVLQGVAAQNRTLAFADASEVERLKWRLMLVDQRIHESEESGDISYETVKSLWGERVDALTQLNKLYYTNQVAIEDGIY